MPDVDDYHVGPDCTREELLAVCKVYARAVAEEHGLSVTVSDLDWEVSTRAKRRAGAVRHQDGEPLAVRLTLEQFERAGWPAVAETVRHELIHVHLLEERGDAGHGEAFRRLADRLETSVHCERFAPPAWWVVCVDCGARLARYRRSKLVEHPGRYSCGDCGGTLRVKDADD
jgi:SprT-like protein